jgi:hypothetical protein
MTDSSGRFAGDVARAESVDFFEGLEFVDFSVQHVHRERPEAFEPIGRRSANSSKSLLLHCQNVGYAVQCWR